jgi:hypothetical protein
LQIEVLETAALEDIARISGPDQGLPRTSVSGSRWTISAPATRR